VCVCVYYREHNLAIFSLIILIIELISALSILSNAI
jgi:hypothetical protein